MVARQTIPVWCKWSLWSKTSWISQTSVGIKFESQVISHKSTTHNAISCYSIATFFGIQTISVESDIAFDIEDHSSCRYDALAFDDFKVRLCLNCGRHLCQIRNFQTYCGDSFTNFQTGSNMLNVAFKTDSSVTGSGFSIVWRAVGMSFYWPIKNYPQADTKELVWSWRTNYVGIGCGFYRDIRSHD